MLDQSARPLTRSTLTEQVQDALRHDIIEGVFAPGQRLRPVELSNRYNVSATPLREALQRLAAQNLVEIDPRMGVTVARISQTDLHDIYWLRGLLESIALERSIDRATDEWEAAIRRTFAEFKAQSQDDPVAWSAAHRRYHEAMFSTCDSPWLLRCLDTLYDHSERYRMLTVKAGAHYVGREHDDIYAAALRRDKVAALESLRRHLEGTVQLLEPKSTAP